MNFYSPFTNENGSFLEIHDVEYQHLCQLSQCQEGYKVEIKSEFVNDKIPKTISSFANSEGGWFIIGVKNKTHEICHILNERADYSQLISQIILTSVTPAPIYDVKFLINPSNDSEGVLLIYVYEGISPPYVAQGTIYVRSGSSSEPIKSDRATIDNLYNKANRFNETLTKFCTRNIYFPYDSIVFHEPKTSYPIASIYLKRVFGSEHLKHTRIVLETAKQIIIDNPKSAFSGFQYTNNSIVFTTSKKTLSRNHNVNMEIYSDLSVKLHIPLVKKDYNKIKESFELYSAESTIDVEQDFKIVDGSLAFSCIGNSLSQYLEIADKFNSDLKDFVLCFEIENGENAILFFDCNEYFNFVKNNGIPINIMTYNKSDYFYLLKLRI